MSLTRPVTAVAREHVVTPRRGLGRFLRPGTLYLLLILGGIVFGFPFYWLVIGSLKDQTQYNQFPPTWIPNPVHWQNYSTLFQLLPFGQFLVNSAIITFFVVIGTVASSALVGYAFARLRAPGRGILFGLLLGTIILPSEITIVPTFIIFAKLQWINTFRPLIVPAFFGDAFSIFLVRQFFQSIPRELDEAAMLDGAGYFRIFWNIFVPNSWPILATVAIFAFINTWSDFFTPLIYLNNLSKMTGAVGLAFLNVEHGGGSSQVTLQVMLAGSLIVMLPMLVVFLVLQRYFVKAITLTGMK
ncbi:MAG TPA: carbohydrate ABC transporter permease [Chloroflexota bacterium]|nr:carbohydrate ABC transporter permease [Chloroflexota bacterium]